MSDTKLIEAKIYTLAEIRKMIEHYGFSSVMGCRLVLKKKLFRVTGVIHDSVELTEIGGI